MLKYSKGKIVALIVLVIVCMLSFRFFRLPEANSVNTVTYAWDGKVFSVSSDSANLYVDEAEAPHMRWGSESIDNIPYEAKTIRSSEKNFMITVPVSAASVFIASEAGDVSVSTIHAGIFNVASVSGNVEATGFDGKEFSASSTSGDVIADNIKAEKASVTSVSGDIEGYIETAGSVSLESTSGDISFTVDEAEEVKAASTSGDITLIFGHPWDYSVDASSKTGAVSVADAFSGLRSVVLSTDTGDISVK